jgi:hypothetical protein
MNNEPGTGSFPTMGTSAAQLANVGKPERGRMRPRGVSGQGGSDKNMGTKSNRSMSYERMGASLHPVMKMSEANEPCAADTGRHLIKMPSRGSWTDNFRARAKYASGQ